MGFWVPGSEILGNYIEIYNKISGLAELAELADYLKND